MSRREHGERHTSGRSGWLRAGILGSNDAIVSTASLLLGVGSSAASTHTMFVAGLAALCAGSLSMAVGEYVSVSSQRDAEHADIAMESEELATQSETELHELAMIYVERGLSRPLALQVAKELSAHDQLGAHLRDELGIDPRSRPRPLQAAWISAVSFALFALLPLIGLLVPGAYRLYAIAGIATASLAILGALGAWLGGASIVRASLRVTLGGALAMGATAALGRIVGGAGM